MKRHIVFATAILVSATALFLTSCKKQEKVIEEDSIMLMSELKGKWDLVSVREVLLKSTNNGFSWDIINDDTLAATGELDFSNIDGRNYTGSITLDFDTLNETHAVYGYAYKNTIDERIWINTVDESNIASFILFTEQTSSNVLYFDVRDQDYFRIWLSEINDTYTRNREKLFTFERAK